MARMLFLHKTLDEDGTTLNGEGSRSHHEECDDPSMKDTRTPDCIITIEVNDNQESDAVMNNYDVVHPILNEVVTKTKLVLTLRMLGNVKWFTVDKGNDFINRSDTRKIVFVHRTVILKITLEKRRRSVSVGGLV